MEKLPAKTGWLWVKDGFALFRKQAAEVSTLFLSYMFLMLALGIVPVIGQLLPLILVPVFAMSFMQACANIEQGKRVYPNLLLVGFRSPALKTLLVVAAKAYADDGVQVPERQYVTFGQPVAECDALVVSWAGIAVGASSLVDGGVFWKAMTGPGLDAKDIEGSNIRLGMIVAALVYIPAAMAFWFAAPLITWQKMPLGKALFYSFFAVLRCGKAFTLYGLAWLGIGVILPATVSTIVALLINNITVVVFILLPLSIILTVIMYCSFYPTYTSIFGKPAPGDMDTPADPKDD